MKRFAFGAVCMALGFVMALVLLPAAQGANDISAYRQLNLFSDAFERVRINYVRPVTDDELISAAIQGMVSNLDPHSSYMDRKGYSEMQTDTRAEFGGLGIEIQMEDGLIKVISPIDDTPAAKAGVKPGDYIAAIDGMSVQGMTQNEAVDKMRGAIGTKVTVTIIRKEEKKPFDLTLSRAVIKVAAARSRREGDVGYIRLSTFISERTAADFERAVRDLQKQIGPGLKGYVLDLRNNPGGLLDQGIQVADDLLTRGEVVSTRGRHAEDTQRYDAKAGDIMNGKPVIVLVNGGSASASEIVAGALQDHKRATILGMTSFGKGSVQTIMPLGEGGGALRLTTARYFTPSGHSIQAQGIIPDIQVAQGNEEDIVRLISSEGELKGHLEGEAAPAKKANAPIIRPAADKKYDDFQLSYALDLLNGKMTVAVAKPAATTAKAN